MTTSTTITPRALVVGDIDQMEACDALVVSDRLESVDIGPLPGFPGLYLRVTSSDLVADADAVVRLMDRVIDAVLDARQAKLDAERHDCSCGIRLEPDELTCGADLCERRHLGAVS